MMREISEAQSISFFQKLVKIFKSRDLNLKLVTEIIVLFYQ